MGEMNREQKNDRIKEFTGWIRKVVETKQYNVSGEIDSELSGRECIEIFTNLCRPIAGNKGVINLNNPKEVYLLVESIAKWSCEFLDLGEN